MTATLAAANPNLILLVGELIKVAFVFAFGACIGSLINVLVYRLPLGLNVVTPASRCPKCETLLTWRENIPVFGWLILRGKCRFCRAPISAEYPIVEAFVGLLWVLVYLTLYAERGTFLQVFEAISPDWTNMAPFIHTWPMFIIIVTCFSCLVAMTLIDAKTCHIPMVLTWVPAGVGIVLHTVFGLFPQAATLLTARPWTWTIASPGEHNWPLVGLALGGAVGVIAANLLLKKGIITRSFADYEEWEKKALGQAEAAAAAAGGGGEGSPTDMWIQYPHARREMVRELIFLAPIIGLALVGYAAAAKLFPAVWDPNFGMAVSAKTVPLWLDALSGALLGYLVGGGVVWGIRLFGSLAFGKEAMGLGDVHMMAAVGACLGWIDAVLGFFGAAFVGVAWAMISRVLGGRFKRAMPFGPFLAIATVLVWFTKPAIEKLAAMLTHGPVNFP